MKKLLLILILIIGWQLSSAQERYYILPEKDTLAVYYKQYKVTWWWGIDPVQLKSGEWVISEECYKVLQSQFIDKKQAVQISTDLRTNIAKYPVRTVNKTEFKEPEDVIKEVIR
jgi:hypothetical protein